MAKPTEDEIEQRVEDWHEGRTKHGTLHEAMGWTWEEYAVWLQRPQDVPDRPLPPLT